MKISMVSPIYNEAATIEAFVRRAHATLAGLTPSFEMILVNDASTDDTGLLLARLKSELPELRLVSFKKNRGQHTATIVGLKHAVGEIVFLMDSDLQVSPEEMVLFMERARTTEAWDVISGCRARRTPGFVRAMASHVVSWLINQMTRSKLRDPGSTFLLLSRKAVDQLCQYDIHAQHLQILMGILGMKVAEVDVSYHANSARRSSYTFTMLVETLLLAIFNFTTGRKTMSLLLILGMLLIVASTIAISAVIINGMIYQTQLPTNILIALFFAFLSGLQLVSISIVIIKIERVNRNLGFRKSFEEVE